MVKSGNMTGCVLLVLCNMAASAEGRAAMLDGGAVKCLVNILSYSGLGFKGLAKEAGAKETLEKVEKTGSECAKKKASRILEVLRGNGEEKKEEEEIDWEKLLESEDDLNQTVKLG
ncbi:U-box domain-containing protein 40 [Abeliophyllum distichum]|uniref:U-box domain-containing protein 40 n=1 Tax=Abeliophyllum distichum TaxID=126358 RepID=A0ABD1SBF5_9LAMI